jgi:hypothetical protein
MLLLFFPSAAQVTIGDNLNLSSSGTVNLGYNGTYGNQINSSHALGFGGAAALNGFYYNPNFLSFNVDPYFNQSRSNSNFGSVSDASGIALGSSIFGGSHFPGSINYSANFNSTGSYGIPGITSLSTNGNNRTFGINWSAFLPGLPTLSVGYQMGDSNYRLYGTNENGNSNFKSFHINSTYNLFGFGLSGGIAHGTSEALIPGIIVGGENPKSNSDSTTYTISASHPLPWSGSFASSFNHTDLNSDYLGYKFNGGIDVVTTSFAFHPTGKLSFSLDGSYTDNLSGSLYEVLVPATSGNSLTQTTGTGTVMNQSSISTGTGVAGVLPTTSEQSSHAFNFQATTAYSFAPNLQAQGYFERRKQTYAGEDFGSNLYGAGIYYNRPLGGGYVGASLNVFDGTVDNRSSNQLGFSTNVNYSRHFGEWQVAGYFGYVQNVQTLLVTYNASAYSFSGSASRKLGKWYWTASGGAGRTGLTAQPGTSNSSESFSTTFGTRKYGFGANYAKSDGTSLAAGGGLVPTPLPPIFPSDLLITYGGRSYSVSASAAPKRGFNATVSYVKSRSNFDNVGVSSWNNFEEANAYFQYQFRQLGINGGYTRLVQGFSASSTVPASVSSFYIGVYRWFNFF